MSRRTDPAALGRLAQIAALKRDHELARLGAITASRERLRASIEALRQATGGLSGDVLDPALMRAQLVHARWSEARITRLNQQLAIVSADHARLKPAVARAFGRAEVTEKLHEAASAEARKACHD